MLRYEDVRWGISGCDTDGCRGDAELLYDDREKLCIDCADKRLERLQIIGEFGHDALANLPPVGEWHEVVHPFREWKKENEDERRSSEA